MSGKTAKAARRSQGPSVDWSALDRRMLADDIDCAYSLAESSREAQAGPALGLASLTYFARVTYEGLQLLRRQRPSDAKSFELQFADTIAAGRHAVKILDDSHKTLPSILQELEHIQADHAAYFGNSLMSVVSIDGHLITSSRTFSYQTSWKITDALGGKAGDRPHYDLSFEMGRTLGRLSSIFGHVPTPSPLPSLAALHAVVEDRRSSAFIARRYGENVTVAQGDLLMMAEAAVNTALFALEPARGQFISPVFRARFVALTHALNSIRALLDGPGWTLHNADELAGAARSEQTEWLLSLRALRNRCMHYGVPGTVTGLAPDLPAYGLVEATVPGFGFEEVERAVVATLRRVSAALTEAREPAVGPMSPPCP